MCQSAVPLVLAFLCLFASGHAYAADQKIPIRVVVVTMFEQGEELGR